MWRFAVEAGGGPRRFSEAMARGRSTVAACGFAALLAGCAPQVTLSISQPATRTLKVAFAEQLEPPDAPTKAKEIDPAIESKADVASPSIEAPPSADAARCPAEMALVEGRVCVDRWEGTLVERVGAAERAWSPFLAIDGNEARIRAVSRPSVVPQGYISGEQAS